MTDDYYDGKTPFPNDITITLKPHGNIGNIGKHSYGLELVTFHAWDDKTSFFIGRFCSLASCNFFLGGNHHSNLIAQGMFRQKYFSNIDLAKSESERLYDLEKIETKGNIEVGNDVWIGNFATVLSGVKIGDGAIIGANTTVTKDVPPYAIVVGNPGKIVKYRFADAVVDKLLKLSWWEFDDEMINNLLPILLNEPTQENLEKLLIDTEGLKRFKQKL